MLQNDYIPSFSSKSAAMAYALLLLVSVIIITGFLIIKKPTTVDGQIILFAENKPYPLVAQSAGIAIYLKNPTDSVNIGTDIAYVKKSGEYSQIMELYNLIIGLNTDNLINIHFGTIENLGEISDYYTNFHISLEKYRNIHFSKLLSDNINVHLIRLKSIASNKLSKEASYRTQMEICNQYESDFHSDSLLYASAALTSDSYNQSRLRFLQQSETLNRMKLEISQLEYDMEAESNSIQIITEQYEEELEQTRQNLRCNYELLINAIEIWRSKYVLSSDIPGIIENIYNIENGHPIVEGTEIARIIPFSTTPTNQISFSSLNASKVKTGSPVKIYLSDYNKNSAGFLIGSVSKISRSVIVGGDTQTNYTGSIDIDFQNQPYFNEEFNLTHGMKGEVHIIVQEQSLIVGIIGWLRDLCS